MSVVDKDDAPGSMGAFRCAFRRSARRAMSRALLTASRLFGPKLDVWKRTCVLTMLLESSTMPGSSMRDQGMLRLV